MKAVVFAYHNMEIAGLEALFRHDYEIAAVFTHEDDPLENCWFGSVKQWAEQRNVPVFTPEEINSRKWLIKIGEFQPDVIFSFYYRKMISSEILAVPAQGAFNLHGSLLPAYRGRCPVNWVLVNGETRTGVTLHYMIEKPDAGDIVGQKEVAIDIKDTAETLYDKLCRAAAALLDDLLPLIKKGRIPRRKQPLHEGSYFGGRKPEDGRIDWSKSAGDVYNLIRAVTKPYPGAFAFVDDNEKVIIWWGEPAAAVNEGTPGAVSFTGDNVLIQTAKNAIRLEDIEINGKRICKEKIFHYFKNGKVSILK